MDNRAQLYTLEGVFASLIVLLGIFFALQSVTTTPGDVGTNPHSIQQDEAIANDLVSVLDDQTLGQTLRYWDPDENSFYCTPNVDIDFYPGLSESGCGAEPDYYPPNNFGKLLDAKLGDAYSYNVVILYNDNDGGVSRQRLVYQGNPGLGATRAATTVTLDDGDRLLGEDGAPTGPTVYDAHSNDNFYAPKIEDDGDEMDDSVFNVFRVEVTVWRA